MGSGHWLFRACDARLLHCDGSVRFEPSAADDGFKPGADGVDGLLHFEGSFDETHRGGDLLCGGWTFVFCRELGRIDGGAERRDALGVCGNSLLCDVDCSYLGKGPRNGRFADHGRGVWAFGGVLQELGDGF